MSEDILTLYRTLIQHTNVYKNKIIKPGVRGDSRLPINGYGNLENTDRNLNFLPENFFVTLR